ncbi:MAG TPA: hypothetical protein VFO38_04995 [Candidatus Saccharimonadales bacterium]|nr:hypothetical protein [Candidatus Saccharimonadales bacterium]
MNNKLELLAEVQQALQRGTITENDLSLLISQPTKAGHAEPVQKPEVTAVDTMFYIAGIVLFAAIISIISQSWNDGNALAHIFLSAGVGLGLWAAAYLLIKSPQQSDVRKGLIGALLLTGSLTVVTGGYIITNELIGGFGNVNFIPGAVMLAVLGAVHLGFDRLVKRDWTLLMGILLCVAAFPAFLFGLLQDADVPYDFWSAVLIASAGLLAYATRVAAKLNAKRNIRTSFDSIATFLALLIMYGSSFGENGVLWLSALVFAIFGIFYLSIVSQNRHLLGNASVFLVLTVITMSFRYFSGYGATTSLIVAAIGLLASGAIASGINKKYFK